MTKSNATYQEKSMNGIITITDGLGTTIENGNITSNNVDAENLDSQHINSHTITTTGELMQFKNCTIDSIHEGVGNFAIYNTNFGDSAPALFQDALGNTTINGTIVSYRGDSYFYGDCILYGDATFYSDFNILGDTTIEELFITDKLDMQNNKIINVGLLGINKALPTYDLDVVGDINFTGTIYENGVPYDPTAGHNLNEVLQEGNSAGGQNITDVSTLVCNQLQSYTTGFVYTLVQHRTPSLLVNTEFDIGLDAPCCIAKNIDNSTGNTNSVECQLVITPYDATDGDTLLGFSCYDRSVDIIGSAIGFKRATIDTGRFHISTTPDNAGSPFGLSMTNLNANTHLHIDSKTGYVGIGPNGYSGWTASKTLDVQGDINYSGSLYQGGNLVNSPAIWNSWKSTTGGRGVVTGDYFGVDIDTRSYDGNHPSESASQLGYTFTANVDGFYTISAGATHNCHSSGGVFNIEIVHFNSLGHELTNYMVAGNSFDSGVAQTQFCSKGEHMVAGDYLRYRYNHVGGTVTEIYNIQPRLIWINVVRH